MKQSLLNTLWAVTIVVACQTLAADQQAEEAAIREAVKSYVAAFNRGDAEAVAAHWSAEAVYTNHLSGQQYIGRDVIAAQFAELFSDQKGIQLSATTNAIEFVSPNVALEHGTARIVMPDQTADESEYTAVYVKQNGVWLLDHVDEDAQPEIISNYEHLKDLEWMVGDWVDDHDGVQIETNCRWTKNNNFLTRAYAISMGSQIEMAGIQIIGWDPIQQRIRAWIFDSDGGFGEESWTKKGDSWYVTASGVLPDGGKATATNIITYVDDDTFTWQSIQRTAGGEVLPNVDEVIVRRQKALIGQ